MGISFRHRISDDDDENGDDGDGGGGGDDDDSKLDQATPVGEFPSDSCCPSESGCIIFYICLAYWAKLWYSFVHL